MRGSEYLLPAGPGQARALSGIGSWVRKYVPRVAPIFLSVYAPRSRRVSPQELVHLTLPILQVYNSVGTGVARIDIYSSIKTQNVLQIQEIKNAEETTGRPARRIEYLDATADRWVRVGILQWYLRVYVALVLYGPFALGELADMHLQRLPAVVRRVGS